jgi:effector-binding domain-containing protein
MPPAVTVETVSPRILAAVRKRVRAADIAASFGSASDQVWAFLRSNPGLRSDGHNVFLYHHRSGHPATGMDIDFGVEVTCRFPPAEPIDCVETPAGRTAIAVHRGPYRDLRAAHEAVHRWCKDNGETIGAYSWEIYGDHTDDESQLETTIVYLLA